MVSDGDLVLVPEVWQVGHRPADLGQAAAERLRQPGARLPRRHLLHVALLVRLLQAAKLSPRPAAVGKTGKWVRTSALGKTGALLVHPIALTFSK